MTQSVVVYWCHYLCDEIEITVFPPMCFLELSVQSFDLGLDVVDRHLCLSSRVLGLDEKLLGLKNEGQNECEWLLQPL